MVNRFFYYIPIYFKNFLGRWKLTPSSPIEISLLKEGNLPLNGTVTSTLKSPIKSDSLLVLTLTNETRNSEYKLIYPNLKAGIHYPLISSLGNIHYGGYTIE